jgi:hypothetical protein
MSAALKSFSAEQQWKVGDRFKHVDGNVPGTIIAINSLAGTATVRYDNVTPTMQPLTHELGFTVLERLTADAGNEDDDEDFNVVLDKKDFIVTDTRTNQLLNELYHDRARLEKLVANAKYLAYETAVSLEELSEEQRWPDGVNPITSRLVVLGSKLAQFSESV